MTKHSIHIDLRIWATQAVLAKELKKTPQVISNWVSRGHLEKWFIPELGLTLVKRPIK